MGRLKDVLIHSIKWATGTHQLYIGMNKKVKHHSENNVDLKRISVALHSYISLFTYVFFKATNWPKSNYISVVVDVCVKTGVYRYQILGCIQRKPTRSMIYFKQAYITSDSVR